MNLHLDVDALETQISVELKHYVRLHKIAVERKKKLEELIKRQKAEELIQRTAIYSSTKQESNRLEKQKTDYTVKLFSVIIPENEIKSLSKFFRTSIPFEYVSSLGATLSVKTIPVKISSNELFVRIQFWFVNTSEEKWAERKLFLTDSQGAIIIFTRDTLGNIEQYCRIIKEILANRTLKNHQVAVMLFKQKREFQIESTFKDVVKKLYDCTNQKLIPRTFIVEDNMQCFDQSIIDFVRLLIHRNLSK